MGDLLMFNGITTLGVPADRVLDQAKGHLDDVVVVGQNRETGEIYVAGSCDTATAVLQLERAKRALLKMVDG